MQGVQIFPTTETLAAGFATKEEKVLTDEERQARDDARRTFAIIAFLGAAPSLFAQDQLVWRKERVKKEIEKIEKGRKK